MHTSFNLRLVTLATFVVASCGLAPAAIAAPLFDQREIDPNKLVAVASPYGGNAHQLLILEQISNVRPCWSESGTGPATINPLLLDFDFTDICSRSTDSNGYSVRVSNEDLNWRYSLRVVQQNNDLLLLAAPTIDRNAPDLVVGRTRGYTSGFAKFFLEPGWRLTKRSYQGTTLGHVYLTNDQTLASLNATAIAARPLPSSAIAARPVPPVAVTPTPVNLPTPLPTSTLQPKPAKRQNQHWWQQRLGARKALQPNAVVETTPRLTNPVAPHVRSPSGNEGYSTNRTGDIVVPTISTP